MLKDSQFHSEGFVTKVLVYNVLLNFGGISRSWELKCKMTSIFIF